MIGEHDGNRTTGGPGVYVAYTNDLDDPKSNRAKRVFLFWDGAQWYYPISDQRFRGTVYQSIGPLPVLALHD